MIGVFPPAATLAEQSAGPRVVVLSVPLLRGQRRGAGAPAVRLAAALAPEVPLQEPGELVKCRGTT